MTHKIRKRHALSASIKPSRYARGFSGLQSVVRVSVKHRAWQAECGQEQGLRFPSPICIRLHGEQGPGLLERDNRTGKRTLECFGLHRGRHTDKCSARVRRVSFSTSNTRDPLVVGVDLFRSSWLLSLPAALCAVLAGQLAAAYATWQGLPLALSESKDPLWWLLMLSAALINLWSWLFIMRRQSRQLCDQVASLSQDLRATLLAIPRASVALLGMTVLIALGTLLFILPGIYVLVVSWLVLPAVAIREDSVRRLMDDCLQQARGQWWTLAKGMLLTVIGILALFVIGNLLGLLLYELALLSGAMSAVPAEQSSAWVGALASVAGGVLGALYMPFASAMAVAHYAVLADKHQSSDSSSL